MATELATRPPAFVDGKTLAATDLRLNVLSSSGGATPLQSRGGVRPSGGDPGLVAALATPVMKVRVNAGIADVPSTSVTGGFYRVSWDQVDLDIDVSSAQARTDLIIVEVVDTGTSAATGKVRVLKGASGGGRPSNLVVNAHWFSLAATAVRVNAEGTGNIRPQDVTPEAPYAVAPGGVIPVRSTTERDAITAYPAVVHRLDTGAIEQHGVTGSWTTVADPAVPSPRGRVGSSSATTVGGSGITTETMIDTVTFTAVAGRRYKVTYDGVWISETALVTAAFDLRTASGSSVTTSGTLRHGRIARAAAFGEFLPISLVGEITGLSAGTTTVGLSVGRVFGSGTIQMAGTTDNRRNLIVEDTGV